MVMIDSMASAVEAIAEFRFGAAGQALPDALKEQLKGAATAMPVIQALIDTMHLLYAKRAEVGVEGRDLGIALTQFNTGNGWYGLLDDNLGVRMAAAIMRDNGNDAPPGGWPDAATDPAADARFVQPVTAVGPMPGAPTPDPAAADRDNLMKAIMSGVAKWNAVTGKLKIGTEDFTPTIDNGLPVVTDAIRTALLAPAEPVPA